MSLNVAKPTKVTVLVIFVIALLGVVAGSGATYLKYKDKVVKQTPPLSQDKSLPTEVTAPPIKLDDQIPTGTITPTTLLVSPADYEGKEVKVRGLLIESSVKNKYFLSGQENKAGSIQLNFEGSNIDPKPYAANFVTENNNAPPDKPTSPVTATGTFTKQGPNLVLKVKSLQR